MGGGEGVDAPQHSIYHRRRNAASNFHSEQLPRTITPEDTSKLFLPPLNVSSAVPVEETNCCFIGVYASLLSVSERRTGDPGEGSWLAR